jgi:hypothetical protein
VDFRSGQHPAALAVGDLVKRAFVFFGKPAPRRRHDINVHVVELERDGVNILTNLVVFWRRAANSRLKFVENRCGESPLIPPPDFFQRYLSNASTSLRHRMDVP